MSGGNFASLTAGLLVRKPSSIMVLETSPVAPHVAHALVRAPIPARPTRQRKQRELPAPSTVAGLPAKPSRMFVQLSATEYEALGLVAVKKGSTPQHLLRMALREFLLEFIEQCDSPCPCIRSGCDQPAEGSDRRTDCSLPPGLPCS